MNRFTPDRNRLARQNAAAGLGDAAIDMHGSRGDH